MRTTSGPSGGDEHGGRLPVLEVHDVSAAATRPLRWQVLRAGRPFEETVFDIDERAGTIHLAASLNGGVVGVASVTPEPFGLEPRAGDWRLRGMATLPAVQRQGVGRTVLAHCVERVRAAGGQRLWCHGRTSALGFYQKLGFSVRGREFDRPSGPHWHLIREI